MSENLINLSNPKVNLNLNLKVRLYMSDADVINDYRASHLASTLIDLI